MKTKRWILVLAIGGALLAAGGVAGSLWLNGVVRERFDAELARLANRLEVRYESLRFEFWSGRIVAGGITAKTADGQLKFLADRLVIRDWERDETGNAVTRMGLSGSGVRIHRRGENGGWIPKLRGYGYDDPELGLELDYRFLPETRELVVERLKMGGRKMGALSLEGRFADVAAVDWGGLGTGTLMQRSLALGSLKIAALELEYHDFGLLPRVFAQHGVMAGKSADEIARGVYTVVEEQQSLRLSEAMLASIREFLDEPDRILVALNPEQPVGTNEWATTLLFRGDLIRLLGVEIQT